ncbi:DNA topoisomerase 3-beta [Camellia lanceoleosa]|uniref:DNA topoisomerase 3-beta n=1 Tax=Camellia lanceoleosa TaxID=1840588 RepID=A0ACC0HE28_9ERIC|nr:DNA topoisomerase 3-beta [Camellia lanceoleosa]
MISTDAGDHPPITPMHSATEDMLGTDAWRLYQYVCQHFLGPVSPDCKYLRTKIDFSVGGEFFHCEETAAPDYLTESELISLMEKNGIGMDASIPVHINNIYERNYVQVQAGRRLAPTALGISLIRGYQCIDPDLCLPDIRSFIEQQITLVAKGQADHSLVMQHVIQQFKGKLSYFVKQVIISDDLDSH